MGAAGTGTTTLGAHLSGRLRIPHFDSDAYFWIPGVPPYRTKRDKAMRDARLDERSCPVLRIEGDTTTAHRLRRVLDMLA